MLTKAGMLLFYLGTKYDLPETPQLHLPTSLHLRICQRPKGVMPHGLRGGRVPRQPGIDLTWPLILGETCEPLTSQDPLGSILWPRQGSPMQGSPFCSGESSTTNLGFDADFKHEMSKGSHVDASVQNMDNQPIKCQK